MRPGYSCVRRWAQHLRTAGDPSANYYIAGCSVQGEQHQYWQQAVFLNGSWHLRSNIDSTVIAQTPWSPFAWWVRPFEVAFLAETKYAQTTIPGRPTAKQAWSSMQVQDYTNDSWYGTCGSANLAQINDNPGRWESDSVSCSHVRAWTK